MTDATARPKVTKSTMLNIIQERVVEAKTHDGFANPTSEQRRVSEAVIAELISFRNEITSKFGDD